MLTKRPHRALRLLMLLAQHDGLSLSQIALSLDCSHRTAVEDLELLRASGIDIIWTAGGYRVVGPLTSAGPLDRDRFQLMLKHTSASLVARRRTRRDPLRRSLSRPPLTI